MVFGGTPNTAEPWYVGLPPGLDADQVLKLIQRHGPLEVKEMVGPGVVKLAFEGDDAALASGLLRWTTSHTSGALVFWRAGDDGKPDGYQILVLNAPESKRAYWEQQLAKHQDVILVLHQFGPHREPDTVEGPF